MKLTATYTSKLRQEQILEALKHEDFRESMKKILYNIEMQAKAAELVTPNDLKTIHKYLSFNHIKDIYRVVLHVTRPTTTEDIGKTTRYKPNDVLTSWSVNPNIGHWAFDINSTIIPHDIPFEPTRPDRDYTLVVYRAKAPTNRIILYYSDVYFLHSNAEKWYDYIEEIIPDDEEKYDAERMKARINHPLNMYELFPRGSFGRHNTVYTYLVKEQEVLIYGKEPISPVTIVDVAQLPLKEGFNTVHFCGRDFKYKVHWNKRQYRW